MLEVEISPGIHITVLTKDEQETMQLDKIAEVMKVWKDVQSLLSQRSIVDSENNGRKEVFRLLLKCVKQYK